MESFMTAATGDKESLRAESISLPSIEELTKNVQSLIDKDNEPTQLVNVTLNVSHKCWNISHWSHNIYHVHQFYQAGEYVCKWL